MSALVGELGHALELSKPKFVFVSPYAAKRAVQTCSRLKFVEKVVVFGNDKKVDGNAMLLTDFIKKYQSKDFDVEANVSQRVDIRDQVALIVCSSGTTGMPKGVLITQENIMSVIQSYRDLFLLMKMAGETVVVLNIAPWFHALGFLSMCLVACSRDSVFVFLPKFEERLFLRAIEKHKVTAITVVPPIMVMLAKSPIVDEYDLSSIESRLRFVA